MDSLSTTNHEKRIHTDRGLGLGLEVGLGLGLGLGLSGCHNVLGLGLGGYGVLKCNYINRGVQSS